MENEQLVIQQEIIMLHKYKDYTYSIEAVNLVPGESELRVLRDYQIGAIDFGLEH